MRAASVELLTDYASATNIGLQVYPGRPRSIYPPCAFVDRLRESISLVGPTTRHRFPTADVIVVHGLFDSAEAAENKDAFVDGFLDWVLDRYHSAGANTLIHAASTEDDPNYVPDWMPPDQQKQYYATLVRLEGFAAD
jgi:hypothetical protein